MGSNIVQALNFCSLSSLLCCSLQVSSVGGVVRGVTDCHIGCVSAAFLPFSNKKPIYNFLNTLPAECLVNDTYFDYLHL